MKLKTRHGRMAILWFVIQGILFLFGGWNVLFGIVCYLGGPDPRPNDLHLHLIYGTLWLAVGVGLLFGGRKAGRIARNQIKLAQSMPASLS
jgi:hypothetical protein